MPRLSHLAQDRRTIKIDIGGETITATYRPSGLTPALEDQVRELIQNQRGGPALVSILAECIVEWDILDDKDKPIPPTEANIARMPTIILIRIVMALMEDLNPNLMSGGDSAAG